MYRCLSNLFRFLITCYFDLFAKNLLLGKNCLNTIFVQVFFLLLLLPFWYVYSKLQVCMKYYCSFIFTVYTRIQILILMAVFNFLKCLILIEVSALTSKTDSAIFWDTEIAIVRTSEK